MENKLLSANEWLIQNYPGGPMDGMEYMVAMERYANYKTRDLQAKILAFRQMLQNVDTSIGGTVIISPDTDSLGGFEITSYYDNFFNLTTEKHGRTE